MWIFLVLALIIAIILIAYEKSQKNDNRHRSYYRRAHTKHSARSSEDNGRIGEGMVILALGGTQEGKQYILNDYTIENNGTTSQIDHILINSRGVFVIETKNYSGQIYGEDNWHEWTQVLQYGKVKNKFYNPVKQNTTHVYRLRSIIKNIPIHPVVVFVQNNTENIKSQVVVPLRDLSRYVNFGPAVLTPEAMKNIYDTLMKNREYISNYEHVANIHKMKQDIDNNICPRCSGKLVLKKGKYGDFWGCENYPKCKFVKNKKN